MVYIYKLPSQGDKNQYRVVKPGNSVPENELSSLLNLSKDVPYNLLPGGKYTGDELLDTLRTQRIIIKTLTALFDVDSAKTKEESEKATKLLNELSILQLTGRGLERVIANQE